MLAEGVFKAFRVVEIDLKHKSYVVVSVLHTIKDLCLLSEISFDSNDLKSASVLYFSSLFYDHLEIIVTLCRRTSDLYDMKKLNKARRVT